MTVCAAVDASGFVVVDNGVAPPNCALIVLDQTEYLNLQAQIEAAAFPALTASDGALIAGAILAVWATGYAFRVLIRVLNETDETVSPS